MTSSVGNHLPKYDRYDAALPRLAWKSFADSPLDDVDVLAFDSPPHAGLYFDGLQSDAALRWARGHVRYVDAVYAEVDTWRAALFGDEPYLAVHIRRGADRLHDFCHTG